MNNTVKIIIIKKNKDFYITISNNIERIKYDLEEFIQFGKPLEKIKNTNLLTKTKFIIKNINEIEEMTNINDMLINSSWIEEEDRFNILSFIKNNEEYFLEVDNDEEKKFYILNLSIEDEKTLIKLKKIINNIERSNSNNPYSNIEDIKNEKYFNYFNEIIFISDNIFISEEEVESIINMKKKFYFLLATISKNEKSEIDIENKVINLVKQEHELIFKTFEVI